MTYIRYLFLFYFQARMKDMRSLAPFTSDGEKGVVVHGPQMRLPSASDALRYRHSHRPNPC